MSGPLDGVRVVEITAAAVGPQTGKLLGELGADVIRIESPGRDGGSGWINPPALRGAPVRYLASNQSKRVIPLDLKQPDNKELAYKLIDRSDVFLENMRTGSAARLGFGYERLSETNPRLVYCSASGFGQVGPMAEDGAADVQMQAFTGMCQLNGAEGGKPEFFRHYAHMDFSTSMYLVEGILLALLAREKTGRGQRVAVSMLEAGMALQTTKLAEYFGAGRQPARLGSASAQVAPHQAFRCQDGRYACIAVLNDAQWAALGQALGREDLAQDPRFASNAARIEHRAELAPLLDEVFATKPVRWWELRCARFGVPFSRVLTFHELRHHPQVVQNGYMRELDTENWGRMTSEGLIWRFSRTPAEMRPAPRSGEHDDEIKALAS